MSNQNPSETASADNDNRKPEARARRRRWRKVLIIPGLLLLLALGYNAIRSWQAASAFESRLTRLREAGVPLTLDQLQAEPLADDENAQIWIRRAQPATDQLRKILWDFQQSTEFESLSPNSRQVEMLRKVVAEHEGTFELYAQAAACSRLQSDWRIGAQPSASMKTLFDSSIATRTIMHNYMSHASLLLADGDIEQALELGLEMLSLSRAVEYQPMSLGYLAALAYRAMSLKVIVAALERGPLTEQQRQSVDSALAACESVEGFNHALATERIYGLAAFRREVFGGTLGAVLLWKFKIEACDYLDLIDEATNWTDSPRHVISNDLNDLAAREYGPLAKISVTALIQFRTAHDRGLARVRCVRILNALQARYPRGLPAVADEIELPESAEALEDPFTGSPLQLSVTEDAIVVYSAGSNGTDDGGKLDDQSDIGAQISRREAPIPGQE